MGGWAWLVPPSLGERDKQVFFKTLLFLLLVELQGVLALRAASELFSVTTLSGEGQKSSLLLMCHFQKLIALQHLISGFW